MSIEIRINRFINELNTLGIDTTGIKDKIKGICGDYIPTLMMDRTIDLCTMILYNKNIIINSDATKIIYAIMNKCVSIHINCNPALDPRLKYLEEFINNYNEAFYGCKNEPGRVNISFEELPEENHILFEDYFTPDRTDHTYVVPDRLTINIKPTINTMVEFINQCEHDGYSSTFIAHTASNRNDIDVHLFNKYMSKYKPFTVYDHCFSGNRAIIVPDGEYIIFLIATDSYNNLSELRIKRTADKHTFLGDIKLISTFITSSTQICISEDIPKYKEVIDAISYHVGKLKVKTFSLDLNSAPRLINVLIDSGPQVLYASKSIVDAMIDFMCDHSVTPYINLLCIVSKDMMDTSIEKHRDELFNKCVDDFEYFIDSIITPELYDTDMYTAIDCDKFEKIKSQITENYTDMKIEGVTKPTGRLIKLLYSLWLELKGYRVKHISSNTDDVNKIIYVDGIKLKHESLVPPYLISRIKTDPNKRVLIMWDKMTPQVESKLYRYTIALIHEEDTIEIIDPSIRPEVKETNTVVVSPSNVNVYLDVRIDKIFGTESRLHKHTYTLKVANTIDEINKPLEKFIDKDVVVIVRGSHDNIEYVFMYIDCGVCVDSVSISIKR